MIQRLPIGPRLTAAFLTLALLTSLVSVIAYLEIKRTETPLSQDIPKGLQEIETTSQLDSLAQKIMSYHQILTESVRNYATNGDLIWKDRYRTMEPKLEAFIAQALRKGDQDDRKIFSSVLAAKKRFVAMEYEAISYAESGIQPRALAILENPEYWKAKGEYKEGLQNYIDRRGEKFGQAIQVAGSRVDQAVVQARQRIKNSIRIILIFSLLAILMALVLGFFVARSIIRPLQSLDEGVRKIGKGDLKHRIKVETQDEIGGVAQAFNNMAYELRESYSGLERKVREKTKELAQKVAEIEEKNRTLQEAEFATLRALGEVEVATRKIEREKVEYEALLASLGDGMMAFDQKGRIIMANTQAEQMLGIKPGEAIGKALTDLIRLEDDKNHEIAPEQNPVRLALSMGRRLSASLYYVRRDGSKFPVSATVSPIILDAATIGAVEIFRDITREKEIDQMKTEFISTVSHELRTPLTVIREGVSLVYDGMLGPVTADQQKFLNVSLQDIDRLKRIIDNLLDVSKIEAGKVGLKRELVDFSRLVQAVAMGFYSTARSKHLEIRTTLPQEGSLKVYIDRDKIIQVFTNLIGNALKFTQEGHIVIQVEDDESFLHCTVADTGRGIAAEDLPKVFGKFEQFGRQEGPGEKGTGLGLAICKGIVEMHGGKIHVESQPNTGSRFIFSIPKLNAYDVFKESVASGLKRAVKENAPFSVVLCRLKNYEALLAKAGDARMAQVMQKFEETARRGMKHQGDTISRDTHCLLLGLSETSAPHAQKIAEKIQEAFELSARDLKLDFPPEIFWRSATYPFDGTTEEDLLQAAGYTKARAA